MKNISKYLFASIIPLIILTSCVDSDLPVIAEIEGVPSGTALIITGASARINQQLALLERLEQQGRLDDLQFISGVSSGAINSIMLNGVLEDNGFDWEDYKDIVLNLSNDDILDNSENNLPVDTRPLWNTFENVFTNELGYTSFEDLIYPTALTNTNLDLLEIEVASNVAEINDINGDLIASVMATTSFPVAFPSVKIADNIYVDGGLIENIPANVALEYQQVRGNPFDTIYIVSYQKNTTMQWDTELDFLGLTGFREDILEVTLEKSGFSTDQQSQQAFLNDLVRIRNNYPALASRCWVYVPDISNADYYGVFDFSSETATAGYESVSEWAQTNDPVLLEDYLEQNGIE